MIKRRKKECDVAGVMDREMINFGIVGLRADTCEA